VTSFEKGHNLGDETIKIELLTVDFHNVSKRGRGGNGGRGDRRYAGNLLRAALGARQPPRMHMVLKDKVRHAQSGFYGLTLGDVAGGVTTEERWNFSYKVVLLYRVTDRGDVGVASSQDGLPQIPVKIWIQTTRTV